MVAGKGGVGKTLVAASVARMLAQAGERVLVADLAGNSGTSRGTGTNQIDHVTLSPGEGHRRFLSDWIPGGRWLGVALKARPVQKLLETGPAFAEMGMLLHLYSVVKPGTYDHCVLDMPATGHALALLELPGSIRRLIPAGPLHRAAQEVGSLLRVQASALLVTVPEPLAISETLELAEKLKEKEVPISGVIVNRLISTPMSPEERISIRDLLTSQEAWLPGERLFEVMERMERAVAELEEHFDCPVYRVEESAAGQGTEDVAGQLEGAGA